MKHDTRPYIERVKEVYGDAYDYTDTVYTTMHSRITVRCNKHGTISTPTASDHLRNGVGCKQCRYENTINSRTGTTARWTTAAFIQKATAVHGNKYTYSKTEYINAHTAVIVTCPSHGDWDTKPSDHIRGNGGHGLGCPKCAQRMSAPERVICQVLDTQQLPYVYQYPTSLRSDTGRCLWYDFYIPSLNTVIEYDGQQHYDEKWVGGLARRQELDALKNKDAMQQGYHLIRIPYHYTGPRLTKHVLALLEHLTSRASSPAIS